MAMISLKTSKEIDDFLYCMDVLDVIDVSMIEMADKLKRNLLNLQRRTYTAN